MSQPAFAALSPLPFELVLDDGEPLESDWHTVAAERWRVEAAEAELARLRTLHIG